MLKWWEENIILNLDNHREAENGSSWSFFVSQLDESTDC